MKRKAYVRPGFHCYNMGSYLLDRAHIIGSVYKLDDYEEEEYWEPADGNPLEDYERGDRWKSSDASSLDDYDKNWSVWESSDSW